MKWMKASDHYFEAAVAIEAARDRLNRIIERLDSDGLPPSMEGLSACIADLSGAMASVARKQLSDPSLRGQ